MADELEDIFGAIDGDEEVGTESEFEKKGENNEKDDKEITEEIEEQKSPNSGVKDRNKYVVDRMEAEQITSRAIDNGISSQIDTKKLYNSIMYAPTTSHLRDRHVSHQQGASELLSSAPEVEAEKKKKQETAAATNNVNTGSSYWVY
mmetsp:Transcript_22038/g.24648  ORF Transcript_22038/g.24648 Transcript_22038/m.24648 type:complete len:147 (-) Transcript_22038:3680-4120(-)